MLYELIVNTNSNVKYEYERYVQENLEEHYTNRLRQWKILFSLNWHYRVLRSKKPLLYWDQYKNDDSKETNNDFMFNADKTVMDVYEGSLKPAVEIYKDLMKNYPTGTKMLLCPYAGTGDVYLVCSYINKYVQKNEINEYVLVVIGKSNYKVANLFEIDNIEKINQDEADKLTYLYMTICDVSDDIKLMHHDPTQNYCGILENLRNINETKFIDMYIHNIFMCDIVKDREFPKFNYTSKKINDLFIKYRLEPNNTVILSPYVNTLPAIPWWVWIELAKKLKMAGYMVCTNCGSPNEKEIEGTVALRFSYDISVPVIEKCGFFIGIRSGFCDVISTAKCKKIIIYQPYIFWGEGTNLDYFSLNKNKFCNDAIEIEYEGVEFLKLIDQIVGQIKG